MWIAILIAVLTGTIFGIIYLWFRFQRFGIVLFLAGDRKWLRRLYGSLPLVGIIIYGFFDVVNAIIILLHVMIFWLLADLVGWLISRFRENKMTDVEEENVEIKRFRPYWRGVGVILFSVVYLGVGWYLAHHVWVTRYDIVSDKLSGQAGLKVVLFADSHLGATFDGEGFAEQMNRIQDEKPDMVLIAGDFVDDSTTKEDMLRACIALGEISTTYGVYYIPGNHDMGYYNSREFSYSELLEELSKSGVIVLEDEVVDVTDTISIAGRKDKSMSDRQPIDELLKGIDAKRYMIVLDHQPNDYAAESAAGADLVLSGHTHGGQLIPINFVGEWLGANDRTYGWEKRGTTEFIVTSGISDWAIGFKTGTKSEYVVLNLAGETN